MTEAIQPAPPSRLRRFITFPLVLIVIEFAAIIAAGMLASKSAQALFGSARNTPASLMGALAIAIAAILAYHACQRWIERRGNAELALTGAPRELGLGLLAGFLLFSAMTGIVAMMGGIEFLGLRGWGQIWSMLAMAIYSGTFEEVLFRGVLLRHLEKLGGTWIALALTSALFGFGHVANPGATWFAGLAITVEAGILLGAAYLLTRRLWLAIGIHAAWNFTQGWVFSAPVSGGDAPLGLLITRRTGPDWLTGGEFGLEASAVAMVVATVVGLAFLYAAVKRGRIVPPMWVKAPDRSAELPPA